MSITWTEPVAITSPMGTPGYEVHVTVIEDGVDVTPIEMNPIRVWNPPELVPSPVGDIIIEGETFRRDPDAALRAVIEGHFS